jgi:hypothetical protein
MEVSMKVEINVAEVINLIKRIPGEHISPALNGSATTNLKLLLPLGMGEATTKDEDLTNLIKRRYFGNDERDC